MKFGLTVFFIYALTLLTVAQTTITSSMSGDWASPMSWDKKRIPGDKDIIVIQAGHAIEMNNQVKLNSVTLRVIGILKINNGKSLNLNSSSVISVISGGRISSQNPSDGSAIYIGSAAKFRGTRVFNSAWGAGVVYGLAYATSTTGNIDIAGTGFILGNLPAVWQDFNLFRTPDNHVQMVWVTSHESSKLLFRIERTRDARNWEIIGEIESPGSSSSQNIYNFVDSDPGTGFIYYRVRQISADGFYKLSSIRSLKMESKTVTDKVYPNPANSEIQVTYKKTAGSQSMLSIYNVQGQKIRTHNLPLGSTVYTMDVSGLQKGLYLIQIRNFDGTIQNNSFVKY